MDIYVYDKKFFRQSVEIQNAIKESVIDLYKKIFEYEKQNITFDRIFNDDSVKYDKHGDFYIFKTRKKKVQIRILYSYLMIDKNPVIVVADFFIKKKTQNEYINKFSLFKDLDPYKIYDESTYIATYKNY